MLNKAGFKINQEFEDKPHGDRERYRVSRIWLNQTLSQQRPRIRHYRANCRYNMCRRYIWYRTARAGSHPHSTRTMVGSVRDPGFPGQRTTRRVAAPRKDAPSLAQWRQNRVSLAPGLHPRFHAPGRLCCLVCSRCGNHRHVEHH